MTLVVRENEIGLLEGLDDETGEIKWKQLPSKSMLKRMAEGKAITMKNKPDPRTNGGRPSAHPFSSYYVALIIVKVIEGHSVTAIGQMEGYPPASTIYYWSKRYKDFGRLLDQAREARSEMLFDKIIDLATSKISKNNIQAIKLQVEALQWAYEMLNVPLAQKTTCIK